MSNMPNLVDIESYCKELNAITGIEIETIKGIVVRNFANVYFNNELSFVDATENIENELDRLLRRAKFKIVASKNFDNICTATKSVERQVYNRIVTDPILLRTL